MPTRIDGRTSRSTTPAISRTTCSINTPPCRPTRCATATSRETAFNWLTRSPASRFRTTRFRRAGSIRRRRRCSRTSRNRICRARSRTTTSRRRRIPARMRSACGSRRIFRRPSLRADVAAAEAAGGVAADSAGRVGPADVATPGARGTNIVLNVQMQYRRTENEALNVFPNLGSTTTNTSVAVPISLNVSRGRSIQNFTVNLTHATVQSANAFDGTNNVAGDAGIKFPGAVATDPLNWGVPNLSFSGFTGVRSNAASLRTDDRLTTSYFWLHPTTKHQLRIGGDFRLDTSSAEANSNARGTFIYTGLLLVRGPADFGSQRRGLCRLPARRAAASVVAGWAADASSSALLRRLHRRQLAEELEADLQPRASLRAGAAVRRSQWPDGQPRRHADISPRRHRCIRTGGVGPYTGAFPAGLLNKDVNNLGPAPRFRLPNHPEDGPARRLQHHLQQHLVRVDRQRTRRSAAVRDDRNGHQQRHGSADARQRLAVFDVTDDQQLGRGPGLRARHHSNVECDSEPGHWQQLASGCRLHGHEGHQPRHPARAQPRAGRRPVDSRRSGLHLGIVRAVTRF